MPLYDPRVSWLQWFCFIPKHYLVLVFYVYRKDMILRTSSLFTSLLLFLYMWSIDHREFFSLGCLFYIMWLLTSWLSGTFCVLRIKPLHLFIWMWSLLYTNSLPLLKHFGSELTSSALSSVIGLNGRLHCMLFICGWFLPPIKTVVPWGFMCLP